MYPGLHVLEHKFDLMFSRRAVGCSYEKLSLKIDFDESVLESAWSNGLPMGYPSRLEFHQGVNHNSHFKKCALNSKLYKNKGMIKIF